MNQEVAFVFEMVMPLLGLALIGYVSAKLQYFKQPAIEGLSKFVFDIAIPLMFLQSFATATAPPQNPWRLLLAYYIPVYLIYGLNMILASRRDAASFQTMVISGYASGAGNLVMVGLPVITRVLGEAAFLPYMIILSVHPILLLTMSCLLMEVGGQTNRSWSGIIETIVRTTARNPMIIAMAAGLLLNLSDTRIPSVLDHTAEFMKQAVTPCALFALGATLARYRIAGHLDRAPLLVAMKCVALPALVGFFALFIFELDAFSTALLILIAAQPVAVMCYVVSERYGVAQASTATAVLTSSLLSVLTLGGFAYLIRSFGIGVH